MPAKPSTLLLPFFFCFDGAFSAALLSLPSFFPNSSISVAFPAIDASPTTTFVSSHTSSATAFLQSSPFNATDFRAATLLTPLSSAASATSRSLSTAPSAARSPDYHSIHVPSSSSVTRPTSPVIGSSSDPRLSASSRPGSVASTARTSPTGLAQNVTAPTTFSSQLRSTRTNTLPLFLLQTKDASANVAAASNLTNATGATSTAAIAVRQSTATTISATDLSALLAALGEVASLSGSDPASATDLVPLTTMAPSTTNAVSVLLSALPTNIAQSVESEIQSLTSVLLNTAGNSASTTQPAASDSSPTHTATRHPASISTVPLSLPFPSQTTFSTTTSSSSSSTSSQSTLSSSSPSATPLNTTDTTTSMAPTGAQLRDGSVAGIATGAAAGIVLIVLAGAYIFKRSREGKPLLFSRNRRSQRSTRSGSRRVFPEVAWLYDPPINNGDAHSRSGSPPPEVAERDGVAMTNTLSHNRDRNLSSTSTANLIPEPHNGAVELASAPPSPPLHPRPSSPLLAPEPPYVRNESPSGSPRSRSPNARRSSSSSPAGRRPRSSFGSSRLEVARPMSAIYEESTRASLDERAGFLAPGNSDVQRHAS